MRQPKANETVINKRGVIEYYDDLKRNTYYFNKFTGKEYNKEWVRLPNGEDRESFVESSSGYWRRHYYDIHTGLLIKEHDSHGNTNLISKRQQWNPNDTELSQQTIEKQHNSHKLF